jgi:hypothetical protein
MKFQNNDRFSFKLPILLSMISILSFHFISRLALIVLALPSKESQITKTIYLGRRSHTLQYSLGRKYTYIWVYEVFYNRQRHRCYLSYLSPVVSEKKEWSLINCPFIQGKSTFFIKLLSRVL